MIYEDWLDALQKPFPNLNSTNSRLTSPVDEGYNCIAWAAGDTERWWWPDPQEQKYWPATVPRKENINAFIQAYSLHGYLYKTDSSLEPGKEKIAIFASEHGKPTHAARQLPDGRWTSKLGQIIDIEHELSAVEGPEYGNVSVFLARIPDIQQRLPN